jgi:hypothetical protein
VNGAGGVAPASDQEGRHAPDGTAAAALRRLIVGYRLSQALHVAAELGIADLLVDGPRSVGDLARATGARPAALHRLLRLLASEGVFAESQPGHYRLTPLAEPLRSDAPDSLRQRAIFDGRENWQAWGHLLHSVTTGGPAFDHALGAPFFDYLEAHADAGARFDALMAEQTTAWAAAILASYDFSGIRRLVDVGGGNGALLTAVLRSYPALSGVLVDLPHVIERAIPRLRAAGVADRCEVVVGDFFEGVPAGGDAYLLKHILHDWDDERCLTILRNCRAALPPDGRLLVVELITATDDRPDYGKYLDLNMLVLLTGRERTRAEYAALFEAADFRLTGVRATPSDVSILEALPA